MTSQMILAGGDGQLLSNLRTDLMKSDSTMMDYDYYKSLQKDISSRLTFDDYLDLVEQSPRMDDVDALPSQRRPAPAQRDNRTLLHSLDPDLCVTPEKTAVSAAFRASSRKETGSGSFRGSRSSLKVRFDDVVNVHQLAVDDLQESGGFDSSSDSSEDEIIEVIKYDYRVDDNETDFDKQDSDTSSPKSIDVRGQITKEDTSSDAITTVGSDDFTMTQAYPDHVLARPEFHTTLRNMKKIQGVKTSEINVASALKKEIQNSDRTQKELAEKASAKVDIQEPVQFVDLVGVNVPEEEVISVIAQERAAQVKPVQKPKSRPEDYITNPPDIMEFFTDNLQKEFPSWNLPGIKIAQSQPNMADPFSAFDIYQHRRAWEGD